MIIGVPKEIKNHEYRVGVTPDAVKKFVGSGHLVVIERGAGLASGFSDADFIESGAVIMGGCKKIWKDSDIIIKVKEPILDELSFLKRGRSFFNVDAIIFTFFHFPANPKLEQIIREKKIRTIPYENIQLADGRSRPILKAMSKVAGEISVDAAAHYLRKENGGKGILLRDARTIVIGCEGVVGKTAFDILVNRGTYVIGFDREEKIPFHQYPIFRSTRTEKHSFSKEALCKILPEIDIVICAAALKGQGAPKIITREMLRSMEPGSVIVDTSIDEGGCCETSRPTSHDNPVFIAEGVIHYCVANIPGVVPRSSTPALVEETLPYILQVANKGWDLALKENEILAKATI